jgi:gamma-glutamyl AIG2-like cyclotransferase
MNHRSIDVFFYGLFMDVDALRSKGLRPTNVRSACVRGFALAIGQRATLVPRNDGSVYGFVMGLSHPEIEALYADVSVSAYRPEAVIAQLADGTTLAALCFNLQTPPDAKETNTQYAAKLRELARRLGLPAAYVETIQ